MFKYNTEEIEKILEEYDKRFKSFMEARAKKSIDLCIKKAKSMSKEFYKEVKALGGYKRACISLGKVKSDVIVIGSIDSATAIIFDISKIREGIFVSRIGYVKNLFIVQDEKDVGDYRKSKEAFKNIDVYQKKKYKFELY